MWSSKLQSSSASSTQPTSNLKWTLTVPQTIPVLHDGTLELDLARHIQLERVSSAPLQYNAVTQSEELHSNSNPNAREKAVRVYVNREGHTVKLAQLAAPPSSYPITSRAQKNYAENQVRNSETSRMENSSANVLKRKRLDSGPTNIQHGTNATKRSTSGPGSGASSTHSTENGPRVEGNSRKKSDLDTASTRNNSNNFKSQNLKVKSQPHQTQVVMGNLNMNSVLELKSVSKEVGSLNHPFVVKEELNSGLKKIMADLASLDLPAVSHKMSDRLQDNVAQSENDQVECENSKENDSPIKQNQMVTDTTVQKETWTKRPLSSSRSMKVSSNDVTNILQTSKSDSRKSSTSSLNSAHKATSNLEPIESKLLKRNVKPKGYDPEKAREYIRQQKQERLNRLRAERERQQADLQARKQKLDELSRISLKLVKASIKRKPNQLHENPLEDQMIEPKRDHTSMNSKTEKTDVDIMSDHFHQSETANKFSGRTHENCLEQYCISAIPLSLDDSNAQLIKDICEMKSKIEAISKSLKTTIEANHGKSVKRSSSKNNTASSDVGQQSQLLSNARIVSIPSDLDKLCLPKSIPSNEINYLSTEGNSSKPVDPSFSAIMGKSKLHPPYLQNLTSNLRKMRESLQSVLNQNEIQSCGSSEKSRASHHRHRRFSSAGSDSAFEAMKLETSHTRVRSLDGHGANNLQKNKITTSFPSLPTAGMQNVVFDRKRYLSTSSETGAFEADFKAPGAETMVHSTPAPALRTEIQNPVKNFPGENVSHNDDKGQSPDWFEPFTSKPYPINFISAVKRKLSGSKKADDVSEDPTANILESNSSAVVTGQKADFWQRSSKFPSLDAPSDLPPFVTSRGVTGIESNPRVWTNTAPSLHFQCSTGLADGDTNSSRLGTNLFANKEGANATSFRSPMLDALNLEEMQAEFVKALNPTAANGGDVTPAEKPLSAPNTPAKIPLKLVRPISSGKTGRLSFDNKTSQLEEANLPTADKLVDSSTTNGVEKLKIEGPSSKKDGNCELVPPNVSLLQGRLERKPGNVDSWVSHSRGSGYILTNEVDEMSSSVQASSSSKDTFEIGHVFNPTALHLQFQAELNILDSFNESLCQVMEVEKVRAVALARHQALSELQTVPAPTEDKSIDVQTSLLKPKSEISTINYQRGSRNPSDITLLEFDTFNSDAKRDIKSSNDGASLLSSPKDGHLSPSSTVASETLGSSVKDKISGSGPALSTRDDKLLHSGNSADKSISEDIFSMSDSVPEEICSKQEGVPVEKGTPKQDTAHHQSEDENLELFGTKKESESVDKSLSVNPSLNSLKADSTLTGEDARVIESLQSTDHHLFPALVSGEDMFQFNLQMLEQLMHEEELRVQHRNTLYKLRVKVLGEMARTEVAALDLDKKKLRGKGEDGHKDQMTALRKKQRGIMLRFQQQREELERVRRTEELAWQERRLMYLQQMHLIRMQISTHVMLHKFDKCGNNISKRSRIVVKSVPDNKIGKITQKSQAPESHNIPGEKCAGLGVTQSSSVSMASLASEGSKSSAVSNSGGVASNGTVSVAGDIGGGAATAGDSESSHLEEQVLRGLNELHGRCKNLKEREKVLHERKQSVEQIIQWRRKLEEEERRLRDVERQTHSKHWTSLAKHMLRDRSTSPFQFLENGVAGCSSNANGSGSRSISEVTRSGRSNIINTATSVSRSASITEDVDSSIPEEIGEQNSKPSGESILDGTNVEQYANESFESEVSEVKTLESQTTLQEGPQTGSQTEQVPPPLKLKCESEARLPRMSERSNKYPGVTIKVPLSPRLQRVQRRRHSSGSDDSMVLSQTETGSEQSDIEGRISALSEQLHQCKAEAERLRREAKRTRNERLIAKEQSLHKQLQAYESYISQLRCNLEAELKQSSVPIVRPQIKQPRVSPGKVASRRQDADLPSTPGTDRPVLQTTSPEAASAKLRRDYVETEFKEADTVSEAISIAVSEAASEIASEAPSEVPSEVHSEVPSEVPSDVASEAASEVSENSSLASQDAPSLVANNDVKEDSHNDQDSVSIKEEEAIGAVTDEIESGSGVLSAVESDEARDSSLVATESHISKEEEEPSVIQASPDLLSPELENDSISSAGNKDKVIGVLDDASCESKDERFVEVEDKEKSEVIDESTKDTKDDGTSSIDQVKSISSEGEADDVSETLEEDQGLLMENGTESNVIQVFVREKEKQKHDTPSTASDETSSGTERKREHLVETITNELMKSLLSECLRTAAPTHTASRDALWNRVVNISLHEATIDIMSIYKKRLQIASHQSKDVRERVNEILAETQASSKLRTEGHIKEMMTTTYGVLSPEDSPCGSPCLSSSPVQQLLDSSTNEDADLTYNKMAETSAMKSNVGTASDTQMELMGEDAMDSEGFSQEWFDEDFGLTRSRREAEELRRQQLQIEQEIEQLQQQQAQVQEQIPYYYVREIPNKPPPPYTPPGQAPRVLSSSTSLTTPVEELRAVCTDRPIILKAIATAVDLLYEARLQGLNLEMQEAPITFVEAGFGLPHPTHLPEQEFAVHKNNAKVYRTFLFDLAKELVLNAYSCESEDPSPPWLRPENWVRRQKALTVVPKSKEMLHELVSKQILVLFGFVPKASKENLTIRWSRKKRDHVDELLVRESQEEERQWTNYEQDEAVVKNNVAMAILDSLLDDTVQVLGDVFRRREQRQHCTVY